ncbi:MAG: hypothetical protein HC872_09730 [Gammaproteobacteria bacterium]|nr:hypothetical protein [Gammaproteobacteria bacterium]
MNNNNRCGRGEGKVTVTAAFALGAIVVGAAAPAQATVEFTPSIELGATWTDNIELSPQSEDTEYVAEVMPGFVLTQEGRRVKSQLNYALRNFFYQKESSRDTSFHEASASFNAEVVRDLFFIDADAGYTQQIIDPTRPVTTISCSRWAISPTL